jgi:PAS domain S-box-containing protein
MHKRFNKGSGFLTSRYLLALLAPLVITGVMQITWPLFEPNPILLYLLAVTLCAVYGGLGPGLLSVAISFLLSDFFFVEPYSLFQFHKPADVLRVMFFLIVGPTVSLLSELMHRERERSRIALDALGSSEERYRKLTENFPNGAVITYDRDLRVTFIAGRELQEAGLSPDHFLGKSLSEITPPEVEALVEPNFQTAFAGQSVTYECPYPDGRTYFAAVAPLRESNGMVNEILVISQDITKHKQGEQALLKSEAKFRRLLDSSILGVIFWNLEGQILDANDLFLSMTGYTREDLSLGKLSWKNITPPEYAHVDEQSISQMMATGACSSFEKEYLRKDGTRISVLIGSALLEGENATGSSFIMDISDRKQTEETLAKAAAIVESSDDAIIGKTLDGIITSWNSGATRIYGYEASEIIGRSISVLIPPEQLDALAKILKRVSDGERVDHYETLRLRKDHTRIFVSLSVSPIKDAAGKVVGAAAIARDITEQRRIEEALRESESFRQMIIEAEPECVKVVAPNYTLLDMNPAGLKMIEATSREQVIGQSVLNLIAPECRSIFMEMHERVCRGESLVREFEMVGLKGTSRWLESHAAPLLDKEANVIAQLAITRDVTGRKLAQDSLTLFRNLIDQSSDAIEVLDPNTLRFLDCNATAHETLGYSREEFLALTAFDIDAIIDQARIARVAGDMEKSGFAIFESVHRRKDGSTFPVEINAKNIGLERNYRLAVVRDITDRKRAEAALRDAERKYRGIFENAGEGIFQSTPDGRFLAANPALAYMHGFASAEELIHSSPDISQQIYVDPARREDFKRLLEEQGAIRDFEHQVFRKDRSKIWISVNARVVRDEKGDIQYYEGTAQDITDRKQAENELIKQKEILQQIVDHIPVMINFTDSEGRIGLVNRVWQQTLGWSLEEILKEDLDVFAKCYPTPGGRQDVLDFMRAATGEWKDFKTQTRDGSLIDTSWARVKLSDGTTIGIGQDVTARKQSELALRQAERKYRDIFENAGEGIFQSTPDGKFLAANPALAQMHGFASPQELIHSSPDISQQIYVDPTNRDNFKLQIEEQGAVRGFEYQAFRKDRSKIWISVNARAVRNENGEIQYYEGTAQDITDRKRAEEAVRESEERYRDLVENSLDLICTHDMDGFLLSANRAAMELMGYSSSTYEVGMNFRQILAPEVRDQFDAYLRRIRRDGAASGLMLVQTRSGEQRIWEYHCTLRTEGIAAPIVRGVARDVTERKRAAEALRESEARYRELFENARDAIYVQDLTGLYTSVNRAAERLCGYDRNEIIGKHFKNFIVPEYLPLVCANISKKLTDKGETAYEIVVLSKDGRRVPVELCSGLIYEHGVPVGIQGIARDITERKRSEQALRSYSRRLIEAQEAERQHIARELHDQIGQVLTAIRINLHTVGDSCESEESRSLVDQGVGLVDGAIDQVRNLSFELRPSLLDNLGLAAALRWYSDQFTQRTGIRTKSASNLPEGQIRLRQELETACFRIVQEALTNVVRHANAKNVFIDLKQVDHKIVLSIKDDGIGFKAPTNGDVSATRLGLRGMKERALAIGGALKIKSGSAKGTEIRATFPTVTKED